MNARCIPPKTTLAIVALFCVGAGAGCFLTASLMAVRSKVAAAVLEATHAEAAQRLAVQGQKLLAAASPREPRVNAARATTNQSSPGWQKGKGWGWIWGPDDEVGSLNAITPASRAAALSLATKGEVYDLGLTYSRRSFKWPGHSPGEIITFRSPDGIERMQDPDAPPKESNPDNVYWHSAAMFISDNVATQIDGLAHITAGPDHHWYNGFTEAKWGGDWGPRKCDASTIPPIIARGVLIDVAAYKNVDALPGHTLISTKDLVDTLNWQKTTLTPGDVVLIRTGTARILGRRRCRPRHNLRPRLRRSRSRRRQMARRRPGRHHGRLRYQRSRGQPPTRITRNRHPGPPIPPRRPRRPPR
jgi:hypothetical protein